ncbi:hypothetical protein HRbin06_01053 [archaeon HR06]|nr:hypothetical protein HRbin06_01053 [archaeon HR06]
MPRAFVMINTELGLEKNIIKELKSIEEVKEAYEVYGVYDIIAKVEAPSMERLNETVSKRIRNIHGVRTTLTMVVIE